MINLEPIQSLIEPDNWQIACVNWGLIQDAFGSHGISDVYNLAGICATVAVETGCTFKPVEERGDASYFIKNYWSNAYTRKQLGNKSPLDAINYHGRGYIQITGRYNYQTAGDALNVSLLFQPQLACQPGTAAKILKWFWTTRKLDRLCGSIGEDTQPAQKLIVYQQVRRIVNGALNGLPLYMEVLKKLDVL